MINTIKENHMTTYSSYNNRYIQQMQSISLPNKYSNWYCQIVNRAQSRATTREEVKVLFAYSELHHIMPKSLSSEGQKDILNYAYLTPREHFICHWLLTKMLRGKEKAKMVYALYGMRRNTKAQERYNTTITARTYERNKIEFCRLRSLKLKGKSTGRPSWNKGKKTGPQSDETKKKKSLAHKGKKRPPRSKEWGAKISLSKIGKAQTAESNAKRAATQKGKPKIKSQGKTPWNKGKPMEEEQKQKLRESAKTRKPRTAEGNQKHSIKMKEYWAAKRAQ
jgi:hypothetical protein